jgi:hypothetical protein
MKKLEAEQRRLGAKVRAIDPSSAEGRAFLDWLTETTLLGGVSSLSTRWPKPKLVVDNSKKGESDDET